MKGDSEIMRELEDYNLATYEGRMEGKAEGIYKWANKSLEEISEILNISLDQLKEWSKNW